MYRIKYLLGSMVAVFSLVYLLFGIVGWIDNGMTYADLLTTFILASVHLFGGVFLLLSSLKDYRAERLRVDRSVRYLIQHNAGRLLASDLARHADLTDDDAREYLERRARKDVSVVMQSRGGEDVYFFGQQFWNN